MKCLGNKRQVFDRAVEDSSQRCAALIAASFQGTYGDVAKNGRRSFRRKVAACGQTVNFDYSDMDCVYVGLGNDATAKNAVVVPAGAMINAKFQNHEEDT